MGAPAAEGPGTATDLVRWGRTNRVQWVALAWLGLLLLVALLHRADLTATVAGGTYLLLAVYGLRLLTTETGQPSLGTAAFLALGAYGTAFLRLRAGIDGVTAAVILSVLAGALGALLGLGVTRLRPAFLGLLTWTLGWAVFIALGAFPEVTGGSAGIVLREPTRARWDALGVDLSFNEAGHLALATLLLALVLLLYRAAQTSSIGRSWAALGESGSLATSLGQDVVATRRVAFALASALATLAGSLGAGLLKVVDPGTYSPVESLNILAAVLIGGPLGFFGPVIGVLVTRGAPFIVEQVGGVVGMPPGSGGQLVTAAVIIAALVLSVRLEGRRRGRTGARTTNPTPPLATGPGQPSAGIPAGATVLSARDLVVDFNGVRALDGAAITVEAGAVHGLVGPNGSGKSTLLRCLAGSLGYAGSVEIQGQPVDDLSEFRRVRAGITRTFQRTALMGRLSVVEHVQVGLQVQGRNNGWAQALFRTPAYRTEASQGRKQALALLADFGLEDSAEAPPESLSGGRQRLLQIATAAATGPCALLLDEPAAGMDRVELELLSAAIQSIVKRGTAVLLIEHNMGFLAAIAGRITVLEAGRVLAEGSPAEVAASPAVRRAYLGSAGASAVSGAPRRAPRKAPRPRPGPGSTR